MSKIRFKMEIIYDDMCENYDSKYQDGWSHSIIYICHNVSHDWIYFINEDGSDFELNGSEEFVELFVSAFSSRNCDKEVIVYLDDRFKDSQRAIITPIGFSDYSDVVKNDIYWKHR